MATTTTQRRSLTPPEVAKRFAVSVKKVVEWIRDGELPALNLARRNCSRPRYTITPESLAAFERSRSVVPDGATEPKIGRLRRRAEPEVKQFV